MSMINAGSTRGQGRAASNVGLQRSDQYPGKVADRPCCICQPNGTGDCPFREGGGVLPGTGSLRQHSAARARQPHRRRVRTRLGEGARSPRCADRTGKTACGHAESSPRATASQAQESLAEGTPSTETGLTHRPDLDASCLTRHQVQPGRIGADLRRRAMLSRTLTHGRTLNATAREGQDGATAARRGAEHCPGRRPAVGERTAQPPWRADQATDMGRIRPGAARGIQAIGAPPRHLGWRRPGPGRSACELKAGITECDLVLGQQRARSPNMGWLTMVWSGWMPACRSARLCALSDPRCCPVMPTLAGGEWPLAADGTGGLLGLPAVPHRRIPGGPC
jgi:hypothetical protein